MASDGTTTSSDAFLGSLKRLVAQDAPLRTVLQGLQRFGQDPNYRPDADLVHQVGLAVRDLSAVQTGSRRVVNRLEQLQGLVKTSAVVASSLEIDKVLDEVMDNAIKLTNAERAYLMLRAEGSDDLELRAARNWDRETLAEQDVTFSRGVMASVLETGEPVLTINAQGDNRFKAQASVFINDLRSIICIPLKLRGRVTGVLYADNRFEQGVFDEDSVNLVSTFANFAAIAIENARHFQRVSADLAEAKREVSRLQIEINEQRLRTEISAITETEYFQRLSSLAQDLRKRKGESG